jgi:hypothetical protein
MYNKSVITDKVREKLIELFQGVDYRKIVSERVGCHPNTVGNVLNNGNSNLKVETALLELAKEVKDSQPSEEEQLKKARQIIKQL